MISILLVGRPFKINSPVVCLDAVKMIYLREIFLIRKKRRGNQTMSKPCFPINAMPQIPASAGAPANENLGFV